jgi:hypothetical protein
MPAYLTFTTAQPVQYTDALLQGLTITPGTPWAVTAEYVRGFRDGSRFLRIDSPDRESINVPGGDALTRLEDIRDDVIAVLSITGATVTSIALRPPAATGDPWRVSCAFDGAAYSGSRAGFTVAGAAQVARLDTLLSDVVATLQARTLLPAGTLTTVP